MTHGDNSDYSVEGYHAAVGSQNSANFQESRSLDFYLGMPNISISACVF